MKLKFLAAFVLTSMLTSSAFAQFFPARAVVVVLPGRVSVEVYNPYYEPIICSGQVFGQTFAGPLYNTFFHEQYMPAGTTRFAFVQTLVNNPFVHGWSNILCRFARF
jgi:hypothetical protein